MTTIVLASFAKAGGLHWRCMALTCQVTIWRDLALAGSKCLAEHLCAVWPKLGPVDPRAVCRQCSGEIVSGTVEPHVYDRSLISRIGL